ncbi:MAG: hypothetical protein AAB576_11880, partial [Elusimicrobiota bacterium]
MPHTLLAFFLAALPAWAAEPKASVPDSGQASEPVFERMQEDMKKIMGELKEGMPKLQALAPRYETEEGLKAASGEREALRGRMSSKNEELEGLEDSYQQMARAHSMQMVAIGLTQIMGQAQSKKKGAGAIPGMAGNEIGRGLGMEDFRRGVTDFRREVKNQLGMDDAAYLAALNRFGGGSTTEAAVA